MRWEMRSRRLLRNHGRAGFLSTIIPVVLGVSLAFAWNVAGSYGPETSAADSGLAPEATIAVEQAATQAWAQMSPAASVGSSANFSDRGTWSGDASHGSAGRGCCWLPVNSSSGAFKVMSAFRP